MVEHIVCWCPLLWAGATISYYLNIIHCSTYFLISSKNLLLWLIKTSLWSLHHESNSVEVIIWIICQNKSHNKLLCLLQHDDVMDTFSHVFYVCTHWHERMIKQIEGWCHKTQANAGFKTICGLYFFHRVILIGIFRNVFAMQPELSIWQLFVLKVLSNVIIYLCDTVLQAV